MKRKNCLSVVSVMCICVAELLLLGCGDVLVDGDIRADTSSGVVDKGTGVTDEKDSSSDSSIVADAIAPQDMWDRVVALKGCGCDETSEACNEDGTCVPRCDEKGRCLHAVFDEMAYPLDFHGDDAFVQLFDCFETDNGDKTICEDADVWRVNLETDHKSVAKTDCTVIDGRGCVLGVLSDDATVVSNAHAEFSLVYPDGSANIVAKPEVIEGHGHILYGDDVYAVYYRGVDKENADKLTIWRYALGGNREVAAVLDGSELVDAATMQMGAAYAPDATIAVLMHGVAGNFITFLIIFTEEDRAHCIFDQTVGASSIACVPIWVDDPAITNINTGEIVDGKLLFIERNETAYILNTLDTAGTRQSLYEWPRTQEFVIPELWNEPGVTGEYLWSEAPPAVFSSDGWIYIYDAAAENIVRLSAAAPQSPELIYPLTVAPPEAFGFKKGSIRSPALRMRDHGFVWHQTVQDADFNVLRTLIVSAPTPPRPCRDELPCSGEGETCSADGFCVKN